MIEIFNSSARLIPVDSGLKLNKVIRIKIVIPYSEQFIHYSDTSHIVTPLIQ